MVGPAIAKYGTVEQQAKYLPQILNADLWFCQGYSEPQAGSDLASLRTKAERLGDQYIVNGQKIWTSAAEDADWIFCLVRTDMQVQQQKGISFFVDRHVLSGRHGEAALCVQWQTFVESSFF